MGDHREHRYQTRVTWTGNLGQGTSAYRAYSRDHEISAGNKRVVEGSSDPSFRGDPARYNPEELLVCSLSACHMLWYLHLCAEAGIVVDEYDDQASGTMAETDAGGGQFTEVILRPRVVIRPGGDVNLAHQIHEGAHRMCFIASSVNFPVRCEPEICVAETSGL